MSSDFCNPNHRKLDLPESCSSEDDDQYEDEKESNKIDHILTKVEDLKLSENLNKI
jgi:hypothetical protein